MTVADLERAFATYFEEMDRCEKAGCHWSLVHLLVILPDICAALESDSGTSTKKQYLAWCEQYFNQDKKLTPEERYAVRCTLLHQGRTKTDEGQYGTYTFVPTGDTLHLHTEDFGPGRGVNLTLVVSRMAKETVQAMRSWFADLQTAENVQRLHNVEENSRWLAREGEAERVVSGNIFTFPGTSSTGGLSSL